MATANTTLREIGNTLAAAESVLLFPHVDPDPDAIGACMALALAMKQQGKNVRILIDKRLPEFMDFMIRDLEELITTDQDVIADPDVCMCIDCNEEKRYIKRAEAFRRGKTSLCIDHHRAESCDFDQYYIDSGAAAAAELIYDLMTEMEWPIDRRIAEELYAGIDGDTGCFMHSNTTPRIHRIAADLLEYGIDANLVNVRIYQSRSIKEIKIHVRALQTMEVFAGGRAVMAKVTEEDYREFGATPEDAETVIDDLRTVDGVEVAAFLREDSGLIRTSLRSKTDVNVGVIAEKLGGGGHAKASGFRSNKSMDETYAILRAAILEALGQEA